MNMQHGGMAKIIITADELLQRPYDVPYYRFSVSNLSWSICVSVDEIFGSIPAALIPFSKSCGGDVQELSILCDGSSCQIFNADLGYFFSYLVVT